MSMSLTILLSKVLGIFFTILGATILLRRHYYLPVFAAFGRERLTRVTVSMIELMAGLFLVVMHNDWSSIAAAIISLIGWMAIAESAIYLALPDAWVEKFLYTFNTSGWYVTGGLLAMTAGVYLAGHGFGFI
jgi:hypothetical protein